ncbi:hypothetical protein Tsubulata_021137 [Turnera subulata]|uniref:DUF4283 domain-containing protein n=1 Tax=Turnera subulata TaxID=218843 RepID=A0A9Q0FWX2_9ROSI|nr:hypothetical protein Tsubulata_021137 [Turnera subulata]
MSVEPLGSGVSDPPSSLPAGFWTESMDTMDPQPVTNAGVQKSFKAAYDTPSVSSSLEINTELEPLEGDWADTVIVKLWGRPLGYRLLCNRLQRLWSLRGGFRVIDLDHNYYLVKLADGADYVRALTGGPWVIPDHYLTVEPWHPNFEPASHRVTSTVAWVRVPGLSTELYQLSILREVCNRIGRLIRVDYSTKKTERGKFAKAAVELDLSQPLQTETCVDGVWYPNVYENLPTGRQDVPAMGLNLSSVSSITNPAE